VEERQSEQQSCNETGTTLQTSTDREDHAHTRDAN
jgi:hypothetical protein